MERTILVVEDSRTQAERLQLLLDVAGYRVDVASNGREGLERARLSRPDLIISDVVMPEMDGYDFCRALKSTEELRRIPFVLLTQRGAPQDVIRGFQCGADNFITKPFEDDLLLERLQRIFAHLELRQGGRLDVEITLGSGGQQIVINADKQQMIELLFSTLDDLVRLNGQLAESQRVIEDYARTLEAQVQERTERLLQTEKIATMGLLLAGVAHELNNPLSVVKGHADLLQLAVPEGPLAVRARKIGQAAERCTRIVRNFLSLARQYPPERKATRLNQLVHEAVELLGYQLRTAGLEVRLDLAQDLPPLWADPHQLNQVLVNLIANAQHAMREHPAPKRLTMTTREDRARGQVVLEVADTGPGIAAEVQAKIFEPFFSTKEPGEGTGLGLSICRGIVESHDGTLTVRSEPGRGAVFTVDLPAGTVWEPAVPEPATEPAPQAGARAILVVDDEEDVRDLLADLLSIDGHRVDGAQNGLAALDALRERSYDVIISDARMPGLDGAGLYRRLQAEHPELTRRFIMMTGDAMSAPTREFIESARLVSLAKPFALDEMRRVIRQVLGEG
ncbi:MAG: response regulator [Candidatus Rokubacteria bacterium]|nr:response regulator [Candidatus Rokubacteria bacterium]